MCHFFRESAYCSIKTILYLQHLFCIAFSLLFKWKHWYRPDSLICCGRLKALRGIKPVFAAFWWSADFRGPPVHMLWFACVCVNVKAVTGGWRERVLASYCQESGAHPADNRVFLFHSGYTKTIRMHCAFYVVLCINNALSSFATVVCQKQLNSINPKIMSAHFSSLTFWWSLLSCFISISSALKSLDQNLQRGAKTRVSEERCGRAQRGINKTCQ